MKLQRLPLYLAVATMFAVLGAGQAFAETVAAMPQPTGYVDDYAGVLTQPAKTELADLCTEVHTKTKAQVFLVTVKTLEGAAVETFANELFHKWKIGEKKTDRGVLLLLAIQDHKRWIEVGYGFEGILPDGKVGDIGREMVPALKASQYDEAARIGVRDVSQAIAADAGVTLAGLEEAPAPSASLSETVPPVPEGIGQSSESQTGKWVLVLFPIVFFMVLALIVVQAIRRGLSGGSGGLSGGGFGGGGFGGDSGSSSFGGGDSGGGSSDSGFSGGDGGDSGGGGAGGDW